MCYEIISEHSPHWKIFECTSPVACTSAANTYRRGRWTLCDRPRPVCTGTWLACRRRSIFWKRWSSSLDRRPVDDVWTNPGSGHGLADGNVPGTVQRIRGLGLARIRPRAHEYGFPRRFKLVNEPVAVILYYVRFETRGRRGRWRQKKPRFVFFFFFFNFSE